MVQFKEISGAILINEKQIYPRHDNHVTPKCNKYVDI